MGQRLAFLFAEEQLAHRYVSVEACFRRRGAYARFKELLAAEGSLDKWYAFEAAHTERHGATITESDVRAVLDYLCVVGHQQPVFFLWRPLLPDPKDDMVLELAVAAGCRAVVTYNVRDFRGAERLGVRVWTPLDLLKTVELLS